MEDSIREIQLSCKLEESASLGKKLGSPNQNDSTCLFSCQKSEKTCLGDGEIWTVCINSNENFQGSLSGMGLPPQLLHQRSARKNLRGSTKPLDTIPRTDGLLTSFPHSFQARRDGACRQKALSRSHTPSTD